MAQGVDYARGRLPGGAALQQMGLTFAIRYVFGFSREEADELESHSVDSVACHETTETMMLGGYSAGAAAASYALPLAQACGMPTGRPIYFACDTDAQGSQLEQVAEFCRGAGSIMGIENVGVYGGSYVIDYISKHTDVRWYWQAMAWRYGGWHPKAQIRQDQVNYYVNGVNCDHDTTVASDFGQWRPGEPWGPTGPTGPSGSSGPSGASGSQVPDDPGNPRATQANSRYRYTFGDGQVSDLTPEMHIPHTYDYPGTYLVHVDEYNDDNQVTNTGECIVKALGPPPFGLRYITQDAYFYNN